MPHGHLSTQTRLRLIDWSACLVEPCVAEGAFFFVLLPVRVQATSSTSRAANAHWEALLLKVLSLFRAARYELLCRCRPFAATARSTTSLEGLPLHVVLHSCSRYLPQLLLTAFTDISSSSFHLVVGVGRHGVRSDCRTSQPLDNGLRVVSQARHRVQRVFPSTPTVF